MQTIEFDTPTLNARGEFITWSHHAAGQYTEALGDRAGMDMLAIPAGIFQMGSPHHLGHPDEHPRHLVSIKPFPMGKVLVTQRQWSAVMGKLPRCRFKGEALPVERVSWEEADSFCQRLSRETGHRYQLPSEAQWEYACRAGTSSPFSFGETLTCEVANFNGEHIFREEPLGSYRHTTNEGGTFPPNAFGLYDMHGNLWEWCADNWLEDYSSSSRDGSSHQNRTSHYRVVRGGSWHEPLELCRSAARLRMSQTSAEEFIGLRVGCEIF